MARLPEKCFIYSFFSSLAEYIYRKNIKHLTSTPSLLIVHIKACPFIFRSRNHILSLIHWLLRPLDPRLRCWSQHEWLWRTRLLFWENENALGDTQTIDIEFVFSFLSILILTNVSCLKTAHIWCLRLGTFCLTLIFIWSYDQISYYWQ